MLPVAIIQEAVAAKLGVVQKILIESSSTISSYI